MEVQEMTDSRIFITGGAGFIGTKLVARLIERNQVTIYDNLSRNSIKETDLGQHRNLQLVEGDVLDLEHLKNAMQNHDYVIHLAGIAGIDTVIKSPITTMRVNMIGSANVLEAAQTLTHCRRIVCFSTSEVFGQLAFRSEETSHTVMGAVGEARWTYAVSKLAEEHLSYAYYKEAGLPTVTVRPFNIYGPGQIGEGAMKAFILKALNNETLIIHGDGTQIRAWCYVDDMIDGILSTMLNEKAIGESFNIGNERAITTIYGLANTVIRVLNSASTIEFVNKSSADIELRIPKVDKSKNILGFEAKVDLDEGIRRTADYFRERSQ